MCETDKVMQEIENGNGLPPLDPDSIESVPDGVAIEQRGLSQGVSVEIFTLNENEKRNK